MPQNSQQIYDPINNVTHTYDASGNYVGAEPGNIVGGAQRNPDNLRDYTARTAGGGSQTDWGKYVKDNIANLIPAAVTMAVPEAKGMGVIGNLLSHFGLSTALGSGTDMLMNAGNDKTKVQSVVDAAINALIQGLPDAANIGLNPRGITRTSMTERTPSTTMRTGSSNIERSNEGTSTTTGTSSSLGLTKTQSQSLGFQPFDTVTMTRDPDTGKFVKPYQQKVPREGQYQTNASSETSQSSQGNRSSTTNRSGTGNSTTNSSSESMSIPGISTTSREVGMPGMLGHLLEVIKAIQPYNANRINPLYRALIGLGLNTARDAADRPQQ